MANLALNKGSRSRTTARVDQLRPLNLPQPVTVELNDARLPTALANIVRGLAGPPVCSESDDKQSEVQDNGQVKKAVESIIETWRVDDEWWREPISRRYVEAILEGGKHVVIYEDLNTNDWYMQMP